MAEEKKTDRPKKENPKPREADEKEEKGREKDEEKQEKTAKKPFPMKLVVMAVLALLAAGGGFMAWKKMTAPKEKGQVIALTEKDKGRPDMGPIYAMETFIVNLLDPTGKRYLKIQIELELDNDALKTEIDRRMPQFKDAIISILSSKTITDINTVEGKMQLRAELIALFNQYLKTGKILNVFFMDFIIQ